jgi:signal peptidase
MNPTLTDPELLEVLPYHGRPVRPGDVVYFQPPEEQKKLVHRVVAVTPPGATPGSIRTRGDNNPSADPYLLEPADVIGQVVAAQRGSRQRQIAGGLPGVLVGTPVRLWRTINRGISRLMHGTYRALTRTGLFCSLLPAGLRPRVFVFQSRQRFFLKLMMAGRVVGQYDTRARQWRIRRPCRLFVNEATLPHPESSQSMLPHETPELGQAN